MSIKQPPVFNPEDDDYTSWKADLEIWQMYTDINSRKQGPAVYLSLKGRARDAIRGVTTDQIGAEDGVKAIINKLDEVFQSDLNTRAYCAFKDFVNYRRKSGENFAKFIVEYEKHYREISKYKLELPEGVQAFFLLNAANLAKDMEKLARATADLTYKDMKDKLMKIFGDSDASESAAPLVKEEVFLSQEKKDAGKKEDVLYGNYRRNERSERSRGRRGKYGGRGGS